MSENPGIVSPAIRDFEAQERLKRLAAREIKNHPQVRYEESWVAGFVAGAWRVLRAGLTKEELAAMIELSPQTESFRRPGGFVFCKTCYRWSRSLKGICGYCKVAHK